MTLTAGQVMDRSAALLSDPSKITFNYTLQIPFLGMAWDELQEELVANSIMDVEEVNSSPLLIAAGTLDMTSGQPSDLLFPLQLWERAPGGAASDWEPMEEQTSDPADPQVSELEVWYWEDSKIHFRGATADREILIRYQKDLITLSSDASVIPVKNAKSFLAHRTAALIAGSRGNKLRSAELNAFADKFLGKAIATKVKDMQDAPARPRRYGASRRQRRF